MFERNFQRQVGENLIYILNITRWKYQQSNDPIQNTMNGTEYVSDYYYEDQSCNNQQSSSFFSDGSTFLTALYYVLFFLGLIGNWIVLWVLLRYTKKRTMTDVFLLNLVLSDLLMAVSLPVWVHSSQNLPSCKLVTGFYQLGFYSGTFFVTLMSMDRYLAIVHAVAAMRKRTLRYGIMASITIWVISVIMATPQVVFAQLEEGEENESLQCHPVYPEESQQWWKMRRNFTENAVALFVCLPVMIFCYVKILVVLSKSRNSKREKAIKLIFTVVCMFVLCWVPYNIAVFLQTLQLMDVLNTCDASQRIYLAMAFAEIIALSHCCINPVIYAFIGEKFKKTLTKVLSKYFHWNKHIRGPSPSHTTDDETSNTAV
ncbi:C-C chemokine receptor type 8 isoform 1-T1 [Fundulus diaphanus]